MLYIGHNKIFHLLFCPDFEQNSFFHFLLRMEKEWRYKVQCKYQGFFLYLVAFETFLLCLY